MDVYSKAARHLYQNYLSSFINLAFRLGQPARTYQPTWYIEVLAHALTCCYRREITRLVINMPPRYLKSQCVSVAFPAWVLAHEPTAKIMCVAGHRGLAAEHHTMTRDLMLHPKYRALFPHVDLREKGLELHLAQGGVRRALTPRDSATGYGADFVIIDDPLPASSANKAAARERVNHWYDQSVYQRLDDKANGVIIVVMQRLHEDDLCGHLAKQDGWLHLKFKAMADTDECYPPLYGGRILRSKGEPLNATLEDRAQLLEAMLNMGAKTFMAQYQQTPYPEGEGEARTGWWDSETMRDLGVAIPENCSAYTRVPEEYFLRRTLFGEKPYSERAVGPKPQKPG